MDGRSGADDIDGSDDEAGDDEKKQRSFSQSKQQRGGRSGKSNNHNNGGSKKRKGGLGLKSADEIRKERKLKKRRTDYLKTKRNAAKHKK